MTGSEASRPAGPDETRTVARLRVALGLATLAMLALSWPLWVESDEFPRVPFVAGLPEAPRPASWAMSAMLAVAVATATAGVAWRASLGVGLALLAALIVQDQHRFQPWAYQYLMVGLVLAALAPGRALGYARWWFAALYLHSGLSKLDVSFGREMGATFLATAMRPLGVDPQGWPPGWRTAAILAMPAWEIAVAAMLVFPRTRRVGLAGAIVLHAALLGILGPRGLGHSTIVLVWNAAMLVEVAILFGEEPARVEAPARDSWAGPVVRLAFWGAVVLPLGERLGVFDAWPSHALYASHVERTGVFLHEDQRDQWPAELRRELAEPGPDSWARLDLTAWSRRVRGVPVYPQGRACNGLAEALAARYGGRLRIRVVQWGRADRWTGRRARVEASGWEAIRRLGDRYRLNAHPAGAFLAGPGRSGAVAGP